MRTPDEIRDRIQMAIVQEVQAHSFALVTEPENVLPAFIDRLTKQLAEITLDEIEYRRRY